MRISHLKPLFFCSLSAILILQISNSVASECGTIQYNESKSRKVGINQNKCMDNSIGIGTQIILPPSARLWLQESISNEQESHAHLICQNKSLSTIKLVINESKAPWIDVLGLQDCKDWANNKLICTDTRQRSGSLFCVLKTLKDRSTLSAQKIERTTSVTMRQISKPDFKPSQEIVNMTLNAIGEEVDICRTLFNDTRAVNISWYIDENSAVQNVDIIMEGTKSGDEVLMDCVESVVHAFPYPDSLQNIGMAYKY